MRALSIREADEARAAPRVQRGGPRAAGTAGASAAAKLALKEAQTDMYGEPKRRKQ